MSSTLATAGIGNASALVCNATRWLKGTFVSKHPQSPRLDFRRKCEERARREIARADGHQSHQGFEIRAHHATRQLMRCRPRRTASSCRHSVARGMGRPCGWLRRISPMPVRCVTEDCVRRVSNDDVLGLELQIAGQVVGRLSIGWQIAMSRSRACSWSARARVLPKTISIATCGNWAGHPLDDGSKQARGLGQDPSRSGRLPPDRPRVVQCPSTAMPHRGR